MIVEKNGRFFVKDETGKKNLGKKDGYATRAEAVERLRQIEFFKKQNNQCYINVNAKISTNKADISEKLIEGKKHIIVSGAKHMIGDHVMNRILYPMQKMEYIIDDLSNNNAYIAAPAGHPTVNGEFISVSDARSLINHNIGSMFFNFRKEGPKMVSDLAVNPDVAAISEDGREVLRRIEAEEDIDISTGFFLRGSIMPGVNSHGEEYDMIADELMLDHSAILLHEPGAKTSAEGVGLFANDATGNKFTAFQCNLLESSYVDKSSNDFISKLNDLDAEDVESLINNDNKLILHLKELFSFNKSKKGQDPMREKIIAALNAAGIKTDGLSDDELIAQYNQMQNDSKDTSGNDLIIEAVNAAMRPAVESLREEIKDMRSSFNESQSRKTDDLIKIVVNHDGYGLSEDDAKNLPIDILEKMAANTKSAEHVSGAFIEVNSDISKQFDTMEAPE